MEQEALEILNKNPSIAGHTDCSKSTALIYACTHNLSLVAEELIKLSNASIDAVNIYGKTALICACENNMENIAVKLINTNKSLPAHKYKNTSPLILSMQNNLSTVFDALILLDEVNVNSKFENKTPLLLACKHNYSPNYIFKLLLHPSINVNTSIDNEITPLVWACKMNNKPIAQKLINSFKSQVYPYFMDSEFGNNALFYACLNDMRDVVYLLIKTFPKYCCSRTNKANSSMLFIAAKNKNPYILNLLFSTKNIDLNAVNDNGDNIFMYLCKQGMYQVVINYLPHHKSFTTLNINAVNKQKESLLIIAIKYNLHAVVCRLLLNKKININYADNNNDTALILSCKNNLSDINISKELLICNNIDYNHVNDEEKSALDYIVANKNKAILKIMLSKPEIKYPTDIISLVALVFECNTKKILLPNIISKFPTHMGDIYTTYNATPLILACDYGLTTISNQIIDTKYSNPYQIDTYGYTALMIACARQLYSVIIHLFEVNGFILPNINVNINRNIDCDINIQHINYEEQYCAHSLLLQKEATHDITEIDVETNKQIQYILDVFNDYHEKLMQKYIITDISSIKMNNNYINNIPMGIILLDKLVNKHTVLLSDGYGYSIDELTQLGLQSELSEPIDSPISRQEFTSEEQYLIYVLSIFK